MHAQRFKINRKQCLERAVRYRDFAVVEWLDELPHWADDTNVLALACKRGHPHDAQWLLAKGCQLASNVCAYAVAGRHLEVLEWAHAHGAPLTSTVMRLVVTWTYSDGALRENRNCRHA